MYLRAAVVNALARLLSVDGRLVYDGRFDGGRGLNRAIDLLAPIVNGWSGFQPTQLTLVRVATQRFPERPGGRPLLRRLGVRSVVVHPRAGPARIYPLR